MCMNEIDLASASMTSFGATSSALIMSWGIDALALIIREIMETKGFSIHFQYSKTTSLVMMVYRCSPYFHPIKHNLCDQSIKEP